MTRPNKIALGAALALSMTLTACGGSDSTSSGGSDDGGSAESGGGGGADLSGASFTVGSKDFDEQKVLGALAIVALENAGATVDDKTNTGGTDVTRAALLAGDLDMYWEYNGTAWISFFKETKPIPDRVKQYEAVRDRDLKENKLVWLEPAEFSNTYGLAFATEAAADLGNPTKLSDLGNLISSEPDKATLCVESEFSTRDDGLPGMEKAYGYTFPSDQVSILDTSLVYTQTDKQDPCNFGEIFTTDPRINSLGLTVLEDDKSFFPLYNPSPVFRKDVYDEYGDKLNAVFDPISAKLTPEEITGLSSKVSNDLELPKDVATQWLTDQGLIDG